MHRKYLFKELRRQEDSRRQFPTCQLNEEPWVKQDELKCVEQVAEWITGKTADPA